MGAGDPQLVLPGALGRQSRAPNSLLSGVLGWPGQEGAGGGPQCVGLGPRALSQPGSPWQLGDRFQGNAGSGVHGGLVQQRLMGNRCEGTLCWSGPGGTGVGTSLPAPVALPPCPPGVIAGPCAGWGKEAVRKQPLTCLPSLGEPFAPQEQPRNCTGVY